MNKQEKQAYDNLVQKHTEDTEKLVKIREICHRVSNCLYSQKNPLKEILEIIGE